MQEAWRAYLELALGMTEASKKKAQKVAQRLAGKGGATAAQLQALTEDMLSAGAANREGITKLVRTEVERALGKVGLVSSDEVAALTKRVRELESELRAARAAAAATPAAPVAGDPLVASTSTTADRAAGTGAPSPARKTVAKKTVAKKAKATTAKATTAKATTAKATTAKATTAKKAAATKVATPPPAAAGDLAALPTPAAGPAADEAPAAPAPRKAPARKAAPRKAVAKKATP
jgi:polyhydroxyalkanoate synthesis regulator phasin